MGRIPLPEWARDKTSIEDRLLQSTAELGLAVRTVNCLEDHGVLTVQDLLNCTPDRLLGFPNFGEKTLDEVYESLEKAGFSRKKPR